MTLGQTGLRTCPDPAIDACVDAPGARHDWRRHTYRPWRTAPLKVCYRCVWCHAIACGSWSQPDPCWEPYHHHGDHISRGGVAWPIGGDRS